MMRNEFSAEQASLQCRLYRLIYKMEVENLELSRPSMCSYSWKVRHA